MPPLSKFTAVATVKTDDVTESERVFTVIASIPPGGGASYGDVAKLAGCHNRARWVGRLLSKLPSGSKLPWWRVVNAQGRITCPNSALARKRLQLDGVRVSDNRIDMRVYRWRPDQ